MFFQGFFLFVICLPTKETQKLELLVRVNTTHSNTINEPPTPLNRNLHICLLQRADFCLLKFSCRLFEATPQQGGPSRESTLCRLPLPPSLTPLLCSPFKATPASKARLPWNLRDHFKFLSTQNRTFLELLSDRGLHVCEYVCQSKRVMYEKAAENEVYRYQQLGTWICVRNSKSANERKISPLYIQTCCSETVCSYS